jgi:hypothetical protein
MASSKSDTALLLLTSALFAVTAWFSASTFSSRPEKQLNHLLQTNLNISFGATVLILRVLQALTSISTTAVTAHSFESIQWNLANRDEGLSVLNFLRLSSTTGFVGLLSLGLGGLRRQRDGLWVLLRCIPSRGWLY